MRCPSCNSHLVNIDSLKVDKINNEYRCDKCGSLFTLDVLGSTVKMVPVWIVAAVLTNLLSDFSPLLSILVFLLIVFATMFYINKPKIKEEKT